MRRQMLLEVIKDTLQRAEFVVSEKCNIRPIGFDIIARRSDLTLVVKALSNVDSFHAQVAHDMKLVAKHLEGSPILIGERCGAGPLRDDTVYARHGVPTMTRTSFDDLLVGNIPPLVYAAPGGFYVILHGETLKKLKGEGVISYGSLSRELGISRRTLRMYEEGMGATVDIAAALEEYIDEPLIEPIDPFSYPILLEDIPSPRLSGLEKVVVNHLGEIGYDVTTVYRSPFDAMAEEEKKKESLILAGIGDYDRGLIKKARIVSSISEVVKRPAILFTDKYNIKRPNLLGSPLVGRDELKRLSDPEDVLDLIYDRTSGERQDEPF
jgi:putative transcriptional regulator